MRTRDLATRVALASCTLRLAGCIGMADRPVTLERDSPTSRVGALRCESWRPGARSSVGPRCDHRYRSAPSLRAARSLRHAARTKDPSPAAAAAPLVPQYPLSTKTTDAPRTAASCAAHAPAGPPPITRTSASMLIQPAHRGSQLASYRCRLTSLLPLPSVAPSHLARSTIAPLSIFDRLPTQCPAPARSQYPVNQTHVLYHDVRTTR